MRSTISEIIVNDSLFFNDLAISIILNKKNRQLFIIDKKVIKLHYITNLYENNFFAFIDHRNLLISRLCLFY